MEQGLLTLNARPEMNLVDSVGLLMSEMSGFATITSSTHARAGLQSQKGHEHHRHRPADHSHERSIGTRRRPFTPLSGRTAARNRKSRPSRPHEPIKSTKLENCRGRPSKSTGPSHRHKGERSHTAWTRRRHSGDSEAHPVQSANCHKNVQIPA